MITLQEILDGNHGEIHSNGCTCAIGKRGGVKLQTFVWRINGQLKRWKLSPERFSLPIKYGLYDFAYVTNQNADRFHWSTDCIAQSRAEAQAKINKAKA